MKNGIHQVLIERQLPVFAVGAEAQRERGASSALPPLYFLHVWWARRPLVVSRAAVLGSLLPVWSPDWPEELRARFPDEASYREWFLRDLLGIRGDPVAARRTIDKARATRQRVANPYTYGRAFTYIPPDEQLRLARVLLSVGWGDGEVIVADPMAGGGSIPFEALRLGLRVVANELNPVACVVLAATLDYPARFGEGLTEDIAKFGRVWAEVGRNRIGRFFPGQPGEQALAYLWARTVTCPHTGKPVPLSPNWWLRSRDEPVVAVRLLPDQEVNLCRFEIVRGREARAAHPERGTVRRGTGISPWTGEAIAEDYIKAEAQAGRMGAQLYALAVQTPQGKDFRLANEEDLAAVRAAERELRARWDEWERKGLIPTERIPEGSKTREPRNMGMTRWCDLFSPRQLLSLVTYLEAYREVAEEVRAALPEERAKAVLTYLALVLDKCLNYNSRLCVWHPARNSMANTFDRHDFSFKWSFGEMNLTAHGMGFDWALDQVLDAYQGIARLAGPPARSLFATSDLKQPVTLRLGNAATMPDIPAGSVHAVVVDPPYYDNVQYGELSDFFYVWLKRTIGDFYPKAFEGSLTDKDTEAAANPARFRGLRGRADELADADYERKMLACFREFHRILRDDGVLTVMFTHKRADAWNALGRALIQAGFTVHTSWPVRTEAEHSLHQAKKNAAQSTILLVCRKRTGDGTPMWWDELRGRVRERAREAARTYEADGIAGVDLYLATYGPVLGVISERWPVLTGEVDPQSHEPRRLAPEDALAVAREEVVALRKRGLMGQEVNFDPVTNFYILAWDAFRDKSFPADEARKLALALGVDLESELVRTHKVLAKRQDTVTLNKPAERRDRDRLDPEADTFACLLDVAHTAMLLVEEDGTRAAARFLADRGYETDPRFRALLQGLIRAIPATKDRDGEYVRPEAKALEALRQAAFPDLEPARDEAPPAEQLTMLEPSEDEA